MWGSVCKLYIIFMIDYVSWCVVVDGEAVVVKVKCQFVEVGKDWIAKLNNIGTLIFKKCKRGKQNVISSQCTYNFDLTKSITLCAFLSIND